MSESILIVEDDMTTRRLLEAAIRSEGLAVQTAAGLREAVAMIVARPFDLILLDLTLPDGDGMSLFDRLPARRRPAVIMLTSRAHVDAVVAGLERGADDYVTKPFDLRTLLARVRAQLRRIKDGAAPADRIHLNGLIVDFTRRDVYVGDRPAGLTRKEFDLVEILARRSPRVVSKETLMNELWGESEERSEKILAVYVRHIRQKIEANPDAPAYLQTRRGFGYMLAPPVPA